MSRGAKKDIAITRLLHENGLLIMDARSFVSLGGGAALVLARPRHTGAASASMEEVKGLGEENCQP